MTNTATTTSEAITPAAAAANDGSTKSFEMALSVIAALEETRRVALEEVRAIQAAHAGNHFAPGMRTPQSIVEAMNETLRTLKPDVHQIARANGFALPKGW